MRFKDIRWLLLTVLAGCMVYNTLRSHTLMGLPMAHLHAKLRVTTRSRSSSTSMPGREIAAQITGENSQMKSVRVKVKRSVSTDAHPKLRSFQIDMLDNSIGTSQATDDALGTTEQSKAGLTLVGAFQGIDWDAPYKRLPDSTSVAAHPATQSRESAEGVSDSAAAQPVITPVRTAVPAPLPPQGQSCEGWLREADAREGGRDFQASPVTVSNMIPRDMEGCAVPCRMVMVHDGKSDAALRMSRDNKDGKSVLLNMESASNYPDLNVDRAHKNGYDIVMTTSLNSDVPAGYLSWAGDDTASLPTSDFQLSWHVFMLPSLECQRNSHY
jgi:hypothetical protein